VSCLTVANMHLPYPGSKRDEAERVGENKCLKSCAEA
jgi:hypothetical protein